MRRTGVEGRPDDSFGREGQRRGVFRRDDDVDRFRTETGEFLRYGGCRSGIPGARGVDPDDTSVGSLDPVCFDPFRGRCDFTRKPPPGAVEEGQKTR